jgi:DNA polymerase III delta prime subunit
MDLLENPYSAAFLFVGAPGTGKTSLALALANELGAQLHHVPSQSCTVDTVKSLRTKLNFRPMFGGFHFVLVDEADQMSMAAQLAWLSILDSTNRPDNTIIVFTCNETERFETRFTSRCEAVKFSTQGIAKATADMLEQVWTNETVDAEAPNFARIVKESNNNIRESLQQLQKYIRRARLARP